MNCQICSKESELVQVEVGGEVMNLCANCSRFGKKLAENVQIPVEEVAPKEIPRVTEKEPVKTELELVHDYGSRIKEAREKKEMKQEELAQQLNEPSSAVGKWERGEWELKEEQIKKLEKVLGIKLKGEPVKVDKEKREHSELTLGDVVEVKE
jgi:putative transcription factor